MRTHYIQALKCEKPNVIPHQVWLLHPEFVSDATGVDCYQKPLTAALRFHKRFDVDNGGPFAIDDTPLPRPEIGSTQNGGQVSGEGFGTIWHNSTPFSEPEQLWDFDPDPWGNDCAKAVEPNFATRNFRWCFEPDTWAKRRSDEDAQWAAVEKVFPGKFTNARGFYCTSFMWAICIFGWDVFLMALGLDPAKTGQTICRISEITEKMYQYFSQCPSAKFVCPHDDICISTGPVTSVEWYKKYIFPMYERIFSPVRKANKPIILTSDGDIRKLAPEVAGLVDGFIFESSTPSEFMFENFGKTKCLIGGIDVRPLTFGNPGDVEAEVSKVLRIGRNCPGYVVACADTIPANVPIANVYAYFNAVEEYRHRT